MKQMRQTPIRSRTLPAYWTILGGNSTRPGELDRFIDRKRNAAEAEAVEIREDLFELSNERVELRTAKRCGIIFGVHRVPSRANLHGC